MSVQWTLAHGPLHEILNCILVGSVMLESIDDFPPQKLLHVSFTSKIFCCDLHLLFASRIPILNQTAFLSSRNQLEHVLEYLLIRSFQHEVEHFLDSQNYIMKCLLDKFFNRLHIIYFNFEDTSVSCFTLALQRGLIHAPAPSYGVPCVLLYQMSLLLPKAFSCPFLADVWPYLLIPCSP